MENTLQFVPVMVFGFATALGMTPLSRQIAMRIGVIDRPKKRNITKAPTPMMGGFAIFVAFVLSLVLFSPSEIWSKLGAILAGVAILAFVGLVDDRYDLGIKIKLVFMIVAAEIVIAADIRVQMFKSPLIDIPITIFWIVAITNATNFLDNMDGLTAGLSAIAGGFFMIVGYMEGLILVNVLAAAVLGSALGFLIYNFNPASTFMGDMGALTLGFVLAILGIELRFGTQSPDVTWMVPIFMLALPIFDINLVVFTRIAEGRSPGEAGKDHTSHRIMSLGFGQRPTLLLLYAGCLLFGSIGVLVSVAPAHIALRLGIFAFILLIGLYGFMYWVRRKYQLQTQSESKGTT